MASRLRMRSPMRHRSRSLALALLALSACGPSVPGDHASDATAAGADALAPIDARATVDAPPPAEVFPATPIIEPGAPADAADLFGDPSSGVAGGPCATEPLDGSLLPRAWLRLRFAFAASAGENLYEIRLHAASAAHDLVAYTTATTWTIPDAIWHAMNQRMLDEPIAFSIRSGRWVEGGLIGDPLIGSYGTFRIAPAAASGSIVYWTNGSDAQTSSFKGFSVGEEGVEPVLAPNQVGDGVVCVGCHSSTPDGTYVAFSANPHAVFGDLAHIDLRTVDGTAARPPFLTASALTLLSRSPNQQAPVFSAAHWSDGDHKMLSMFPLGGRAEILWTDLEATSTAQDVGWGIVARTGDVNDAGAAVWSHGGTTIAYSSAPLVTSGMNLDEAHGDIYTVPYNGGSGGAATPLPGASDPAYTEHYAAFSSDDQLLAFIRVAAAQNPYDNAQSEVFVIPAAGGTPVRLVANDPASCTGQSSPGLANTWPKWSPTSDTVDGKTYHWLTFSSRRGSGVPQIYVSPVVVSERGIITTYPALSLWNQPASEHNHTPAWDTFEIPPID
jgi:WD40 repeat protein